MSWAYYDEPGHRDGLLMGRKGHNALLKAEALFASLNAIDPQINYPPNWKGLELKDAEGNKVTCERIRHSPEKQEIELALMAIDIPPAGYKTYYVSEVGDFPRGYREIGGDSIENDLIRVMFGPGGITGMFDKVRKREVLKTEKFFG